MKRFIIVIGIVVFLIVIATIATINSKSVLNPYIVAILDVNVSDKKITLKGTLVNSSLQFKGYTVKYENEILYISIEGGLISLSKPKDIDISIDNTYGKIKKIYLQGDTTSNIMLIYPKKNK